MSDRLQIGIDIGGTKMLTIAKNSTLQARSRRSQLTRGKNFAAADAQIALERFIATLATPPHSIGIAVPGLVDRQGVVIACDVLPLLVGWQPTIALSSICPIHVFNDAEAALMQTVRDLQPQTVAAVVMVGRAIWTLHCTVRHCIVCRSCDRFAGSNSVRMVEI